MIKIHFNIKNKKASLNSYKLNETIDAKNNFTLFLTPQYYFQHKHQRYLIF